MLHLQLKNRKYLPGIKWNVYSACSCICGTILYHVFSRRGNQTDWPLTAKQCTLIGKVVSLTLLSVSCAVTIKRWKTSQFFIHNTILSDWKVCVQVCYKKKNNCPNTHECNHHWAPRNDGTNLTHHSLLSNYWTRYRLPGIFGLTSLDIIPFDVYLWDFLPYTQNRSDIVMEVLIQHSPQQDFWNTSSCLFHSGSLDM